MKKLNLLINCNQLKMFRAKISPILRSTRLCFLFVVQSTDDAYILIIVLIIVPMMHVHTNIKFCQPCNYLCLLQLHH